MIYVCTVHHETEKWISPQTHFLNKYLNSPSKVFACVPKGRATRNFYLETVFEPASKASQNHADKLNHLANLVLLEAAPGDILIFLDGDAFPIAPLDGFLETTLKKFPFAAIQRLENDGDMQPHPSFAATTVQFWRDLKGDWSPGHRWTDKFGNSVTDSGGNLLKEFVEKDVLWHPLRRTNRRNLHGLWFGIYDDLIYHHGAGYRVPVSRLDENSKLIPEVAFETTSSFEEMKRLHERVFEILTVNDDFHYELGFS